MVFLRGLELRRRGRAGRVPAAVTMVQVVSGGSPQALKGGSCMSRRQGRGRGEPDIGLDRLILGLHERARLVVASWH